MTKIFFSQKEFIKIRATVGPASHSTFSSDPFFFYVDLNTKKMQVEVTPSVVSLINRMNSHVTCEKDVSTEGC